MVSYLLSKKNFDGFSFGITLIIISDQIALSVVFLGMSEEDP